MVTPGQYGADINFGDEAEVADAFIRDAHQKVQQKGQELLAGFQQLPTRRDDQMYDDQQQIVASKRGEQYDDIVGCFVSPLLRLGFLIQLLCLAFVTAVYYGEGGRGAFSFDLFNLPENLRTAEKFSCVLMTLQGAYLISCLFIAGFQAFVVDNSKMPRGFRAGSKILGGAVVLDITVVALRLLQYVYAYHFLGKKWWLKYAQTKSDWCLFYAGAGINGVVLIMYGLAIFYMETYHDDGTIEEIAWAALALFGLAGAFEILMVVTGFGTFYTIFQMAAVTIATVWAFSFEPLLHFSSPAFHNRDINEGILPHEDESADRTM